MSISTVLGARLQRWLLNYTAGTWTCAVASGNAVNVTVGEQPAAGTLPSGQSYPIFDGVNDSVEAPPMTIGGSYAGTQNYICGFLIRISTAQAGNLGFVVGIDDYNNYYNGGALQFAGSESNADLADSAWHRVIIVKNGAGAVTMYVDGVAQTSTGGDSLGSDWRTSEQLYADRFGGGFPLNASMASFFYGYDATTPFSGATITSLDTELNALLSASGTTQNAAGSASVVVTASGLAARPRQASATATVQFAAAGTGVVPPPAKQASSSASIAVQSNNATANKSVASQIAGSASLSFLAIGTAQSGSYNPISEGNCLHWREADSSSIVLVSGQVSSWPDTSLSGDANRNLTQGTAANRPTFNSSNPFFNGRPTVDFDGVNDVLDSGLFTGRPIAQPTTYYFVTRWGTTANTMLFDAIPAASNRHLLLGTSGRQGRTIGINPIGVLPREGEPVVLSLVFSGSTTRMYIGNPVDATEIGSDTATHDSFRLGASNGGASFFSGSVAAFGAFQSNHTLATRLRIFEYLETKYISRTSPYKHYPDAWFRGNYTGTSWTNSFGTNVTTGDRDLDAGTPPSVGTAVNGYTPARFNGTTQYLQGSTVSYVYGANSGSIAAYFKSDITTANGAPATAPAILTDTGGYLSIGFTTGVKFELYDGVNNSVTIPATTGSYHLAQFKWNGTNFFARVDMGAWVTASVGPINSGYALGAFRVGTNYNQTSYFSGSILEIFSRKEVLTDAEFDEYYAYAKARYFEPVLARGSANVAFGSSATATVVAAGGATKSAAASANLAIQSSGSVAKTTRTSSSASIVFSAASTGRRNRPATSTANMVLQVAGTASRFRHVATSASVVFASAGRSIRTIGARAAAQVALSATVTVQSRIKLAQGSIAVQISTVTPITKVVRGSFSSALISFEIVGDVSLTRSRSANAELAFMSAAAARKLSSVRSQASIQIGTTATGSRTVSASASCSLQVSCSATAEAANLTFASGSATVVVDASAKARKHASPTASATVRLNTTAAASLYAQVKGSASIQFSAQGDASSPGTQSFASGSASFAFGSNAVAAIVKRVIGGANIAIHSDATARKVKSAASTAQIQISSAARASAFRTATAFTQILFSVSAARPANDRQASGSASIWIIASNPKQVRATASISLGCSASAQNVPFVPVIDDSLLGRPRFLRRRGGSSSATKESYTTVSIDLLEVNDQLTSHRIRGRMQVQMVESDIRVRAILLKEADPTREEASVIVESLQISENIEDVTVGVFGPRVRTIKKILMDEGYIVTSVDRSTSDSYEEPIIKMEYLWKRST